MIYLRLISAHKQYEKQHNYLWTNYLYWPVLYWIACVPLLKSSYYVIMVIMFTNITAMPSFNDTELTSELDIIFSIFAFTCALLVDVDPFQIWSIWYDDFSTQEVMFILFSSLIYIYITCATNNKMVSNNYMLLELNHAMLVIVQPREWLAMQKFLATTCDIHRMNKEKWNKLYWIRPWKI